LGSLEMGGSCGRGEEMWEWRWEMGGCIRDRYVKRLPGQGLVGARIMSRGWHSKELVFCDGVGKLPSMGRFIRFALYLSSR